MMRYETSTKAIGNNNISAVDEMAHGSEMKWNLCLRVIAGLRWYVNFVQSIFAIDKLEALLLMLNYYFQFIKKGDLMLDT